MSDSKMHYVPIILECEHISKDSKERVYLPRVRKSLEQRIFQKAAKEFFRKVLILIFKLLVSIAITFPFVIWAVEYAYIERGYMAYGGEYLFIAILFYLVYCITGVLLKE